MHSDTTEILSFTDGRGRKITREVKQTLDIRDYLGLAGFPLLVLAANPNLSVWDLVRYLDHVAETTSGVVRPKTWVHKRRKLFRRPDAGYRAYDPDGRHARAVQIMAAYPAVSARDLTKVLAKHGIKRGKDWVREHRCDGMMTGD